MNNQLQLVRSLRDRLLFWKTSRLLKQGQVEKVVTILQRALETTNRKCGILLYLARIYHWNSKPAKVLEIAQAVLDQHDDNNDCSNTIWEIVLLLYKLKAFEETLPYIQFCMNHWPDIAQVYALQGLVQLELKNHAEAEIAFARALQLDETDPDARYGTSELYRVTGRRHQIQEFLEEYLAVSPDLPTSHVLMAQFLHDTKGDCRAALPYYERGIVLAQNWRFLRASKHYITINNYPHEIYSGYITASLGCGLDDVAKDFITNRFQGATYHAWISSLLWETGYLDEAIAKAEETLKNTPDIISLRIDLGLMYCQMGNFKEAEHQIKTAININPNKASVDYLAFLMVILSELGQFEEIKQVQAEALRRDDARMWYVLANTYGDINNWKMALEAATNALALIPDWIRAQQEFARAKAHLDQYDDAIEAYQNILRWQPRNGKIWLELAQAYFSIEDKEKALDAVRLSLRTRNLSSVLKTTAIDLKDELENTLERKKLHSTEYSNE